VFRRVGDITAEEMAAMLARYPAWDAAGEYATGDRATYDGSLYLCVQAHIAQADWRPDVVPALWTEIAPEGVIPVWVQPTGAQDAYNTGDRVLYPDENGTVYESTIDANVWSPDAYPAGWQEVV